MGGPRLAASRRWGRVVRLTRSGAWRIAPLVAVAVALACWGVQPGGVRAQLLDPPAGWDMWDPEWTQRDVWAPDRMDASTRERMTRHETFIREGVPAPYAGVRNPSSRTPVVFRAGAALYGEHCARCHDPSGMGGGDAGLALYPSPALLAQLIRMPDAVDEYLLWAISEGGVPFGTAMPAFKDELSREQIWQIVTYMRAGFPPVGEAGRP